MFNTRKIKIFIIASLSFVFSLMSFSPGVLAELSNPISKVEGKLQGISDEEKKVLQNLFDMEHEIEGMEEEEKGLARDIGALNGETRDLEEKIAGEEKAFEKKRDVLKQVLKIYQRKGPGSYLEIVMDSENLNMFLWRLSTLQDLSRNTAEILKTLEESSKKLAEKKQGVAQKLALLEDKKKRLKESLDKKLQLKADKEKYLAALKEDRSHYVEQLSNMQRMWNELKLLFSQITVEFSNIVKDGKLPMDAMKINLTLRGVEASVDEKTFNSVTAGYPHLLDMTFSFYPGRVEVRLPKNNFVLTGKFQAMEGNTLKFAADGGSFYGMQLERDTIEELFKESNLELDLKELLGVNILSSVETSEGQLKFIIKPVF